MIQNNLTAVTCWIGVLLTGLSCTDSVDGQQFRAPQSRTKDGAVLGGIAGAILGGIAGHQNDETPEGIALGGAVGAIAGGLMGNSQDRMLVQQQQYQQQARQAYQDRVGRAVSLQDAIMLSQNGVSPNLILNQINEHGVTHRLAVSDIIHLHKNGVSEVVINAMQEARLASQPAAATRISQLPAPVVTHRETIVVRPAPPVGMIHVYDHPRFHHHPRSGFHYYHHFR